jgi:hypothetical protein
MIPLTELLSHEIEEVLATPLLRQAVVSYTRNLFYGGNPVSSCDSSVRLYFRKLQLEGAEIQKKLDTMKYQLKLGLVIVFSGQAYNSSTMTDEIAEDYLGKFPAMAKNFIMPKEAPVPAKAETEKEKLTKRAVELGIDGKDLSIKKLKEAIADAEIAMQKQKKEELILKAIELDLEVTEEMSVEEIEALIAEKDKAGE